MKDSQRKAMFAKNKGNIIYDSHDGKYKLNGIPIHKGMKSKKEKEQLKFLDSNKQIAHHVGSHTQNNVDWRNMNRELSDIENKMNTLDQKSLDGKISDNKYLLQHNQLEKQFNSIRWHRYGHLR
tara:strand:- start:45 stop:416 length:372 start_codon:yes stop_codon:yes gene_type:complete